MGIIQLKPYNSKHFRGSHSKGLQVNASSEKNSIFLDTCTNLH